MPRTRSTETAQRLSPRGPLSVRPSSSDSDSSHARPRTERNTKLADGRSPRGSQSHPLNQKKLGTRIADLESQLGLAQEELKSLKDQLVSTEAAKKVAQDQLDKKSKKQHKENEENHSTPIESSQAMSKKDGTSHCDDIQQGTDVFEVPIDQKIAVETKSEVEVPVEEDKLKPKPVFLPTESPESPLYDELALKNDEINLLKRNLDEKEKELEAIRLENESLKTQLDEKSEKISSAESEIGELNLKLTSVSEELEKSKRNGAEMNVKLEAVEKAKEELEEEMKRLRVQTEQWRKAADAAASVLAGDGRRISERCGSMDKLYSNTFNHVGGYDGYVGSPGMLDDSDDVFGGEKRKGIRMFGDLWKKKNQR